jgi:hypothetical protein
MKAAIPSLETITPTTPLRLDIAARLAFPDSSMDVSGLRGEINKGNLGAEKIAGKLYVTLAGIAEMRQRCAVSKAEALPPGSQGKNRGGPRWVILDTVDGYRT